jgi:hypothetical protein
MQGRLGRRERFPLPPATGHSVSRHAAELYPNRGKGYISGIEDDCCSCWQKGCEEHENEKCRANSRLGLVNISPPCCVVSRHAFANVIRFNGFQSASHRTTCMSMGRTLGANSALQVAIFFTVGSTRFQSMGVAVGTVTLSR